MVRDFENIIDNCDLCAVSRFRESIQFDENSDAAFGIWHQLKNLRQEIALGGKNLLVALISQRIGLYSQNDIALFDAMSELMGGDVHDLVCDLLQEFEGPDPEKHLWVHDSSGTYRLHY